MFEDRPLGDRHEVTDLAIGVPFVSTLPVYLDSFVEPGLSVRVDGTPFKVTGRTKPFKDSLETVLELRLAALDLTKYLPFVPLALPFSVGSAELTLALDLSFVRARADAPSLKVRGRLALEKLDVREKRKAAPALLPLLSLEKLEIAVGEADLTAQDFRVDKVLLSGLDLHVRRLRDGSLNLAHLAPASPAPVPGAARAARAPAGTTTTTARKQAKAGAAVADAGAGLRFALGAFKLEKAAVHVRDESVSPAFTTDVQDIAVSVQGLSNKAGATAKVSVGLRAVPGGTVTQQGTLSLTPMAAAGTVAIEGIEPGRFAAYYRDAIAFDVVKGKLRLGAGYHYQQDGARATVRLADAFLELGDLALRRRDARDDFFRMGALAVRGGKVDLGERTVSVAEISTRDGRLRAARDAKGVVDLSTLVAAPPVAAAAAAVPRRAPPAPAAEKGSGPAWTISLGRIDVEKWGARFDDRAVTPPAALAIEPITLHATNVSTAPGSKLTADVRLGINKTGRLQLTGTVVPEPALAANVRFDVRGIEILPLQPYFQDQVSLLVTAGTVSVKGQASLKSRPGPDPQINVTAEADLDVDDLTTVDRDKREPLLKWKSFHVGGIRASTAPPMAVAIGQVALTDFQSRLILFPDAHFNLQDALAKPGASGAVPSTSTSTARPKPTATATSRPTSTPGPAAAAPPPQVTIGQVTLQGGNVMFSDRLIRPSYTAELTELAGRVSGLSSTPGSTADVDIRGSVNRSGVLTIVGKTNPLAKDLLLDVQVALKGFELPPTSPYAGKYAGFGISKGKLDLSLDYKIAGGKLDAKNKLVLDQLTFGDKVDSADATKAPVRLAVALLKDRHGVIDIDLPIAGSLDDPQFKVWRAVLKVLGNLVVKVVTAPFTFIASMFGGGDELSRIDFPAGTAALDATARKRMTALGRALQERPGISFEIEGGADPRQDRDGLRRFLYERKLKAQKLTELVQSGAAVPSLDQLPLDPAERDRLLEKAYQAEKFPKPKNALGMEKTLPPPEMEKLMLVNTRVDDDELRALALRRATAVQATLAKATPASASRLYLVTPRLAGPGGHVELKLKKD
jgi:hypothetical protein